MTQTADCGHLTVSTAALRLITSAAVLRRARVATRPASPALYDELLRITALVLGGADATEVAISAAPRNVWIMTNEAARRLGVTPNAVRRALGEGRLAGRKSGRIWLVDAADVTRRVCTDGRS